MRVAEHVDDAEESSEGESDAESEAAVEDGAETLGESDQAAEAAGAGAASAPSGSRPSKPKISIKLGGSADICHVCGKRGHMAGFVGAKYVDCPNKPCYLCGTQGHSTMTCPYRVAPGHGCVKAAEVNSDNILTTLRKRERGGKIRCLPQLPKRQWRIEGAVLKLHSRRVTCLEFHPRNPSLVLSGDKKGQIAVWDFDKVYERTVYPGINRWQTMGLRFLPGGDGCSCATTSADGTVKVFDVETSESRTLYDANPGGWDAIDGDHNKWVTLLGLDVLHQVGVVVVGDSIGQLHFLDPRLPQPVASTLVHKKGTKVTSVSSNPLDSNLLLTAGNDYQARLLDVRNLTGDAPADPKGKAPARGASAAPHPAQLASLAHTKVINSAYFSPVSGRKILTTCQDNRIRVWDYVYRTDQTADREIVHSQNFNRYITPFRAEWDPKDPAERLIICGRYISEDFGGVALHPIDLLDAATGELVGELIDTHLTTITPVNKPHPTRDVLISGSSRSLYAWHAVPREDEEDAAAGRSANGDVRQQRQRQAGDDAPLGLQFSGDFVFFDADEDADSAKKKKKGGKAAGGKAGTEESLAPAGSKAAKGKAAASKAAAGAAGQASGSNSKQQKRRRKKDESDSDSD
ncbi:hypothetical protein N2152v2_008846 [Parachlorella kessleri]